MVATITERPAEHFARWEVTAVYRSETGPIDVVHHIEELEELQDLMERGPHWSTIKIITIRYRGVPEKLTLEEVAA